MKITNRRRFLQIGASALTLPFLGRSMTAEAREAGPKRLLVFHWPQGTVLSQTVPTGTESNFTLPYILEPLQSHQDKLVVLSGIDNRMPGLNSVGNAHFNANLTFLTGRPFLTQDAQNLSAGGPSIEQLVSEQIASPAPFKRLDFAVGGNETTDGIFNPYESSYFWHGPNDPVAYFNDPATALLRIFGDDSLSPADAWALRARRASVLDGVQDQMKALMKTLPSADRARLMSHQEKLFSLEQRIVAGTGDCKKPDLIQPPGYSYGVDDPITAGLFSDIITSAFSCDLTRVATLHFANSHAPTFPWLTAQNGGNPIVDTGLFDNWHATVHADHQPGMEHVYRWYMEVLASLLDRLAATEDADGDNLLDTTLVVALSEYSSGRHWYRALPVILAGCAGQAELGRWLNYMSVDIGQWNGYQDSTATTNQLWTSVMQMFGSQEQTFGHVDPSIPNGPLPGLIA